MKTIILEKIEIEGGVLVITDDINVDNSFENMPSPTTKQIQQARLDSLEIASDLRAENQHREQVIKNKCLQLQFEADTSIEAKKITSALSFPNKIKAISNIAKTKINGFEDFAGWLVDYSKMVITVTFKDKRPFLNLVPEDFGKRTSLKMPQNWANLMFILQNLDKEVSPSQRQDINNKLKKIFGNESINFFPKSKALPSFIKFTRAKIDRRRAAYEESTNNSIQGVTRLSESEYDLENENNFNEEQY